MENRNFLNLNKYNLKDLYNIKKLETQKEIALFKFKFSNLKKNYEEFYRQDQLKINYFKEQINDFKNDREDLRNNLNDIDERIKNKEKLFGFKDYDVE